MTVIAINGSPRKKWNTATLRRILAIPYDRELVAVTPLGYPEKVPPAPPRLDPARERKVRWMA